MWVKNMLIACFSLTFFINMQVERGEELLLISINGHTINEIY